MSNFGPETKTLKEIQPIPKSSAPRKSKKKKYKERKPASEIDYKQRCRFCVGRLISTEKHLIKNRAKDFLASINIHLNPSNKYPTYLCQLCDRKIDRFQQFRMRILESQEIFSEKLRGLEENLAQMSNSTRINSTGKFKVLEENLSPMTSSARINSTQEYKVPDIKIEQIEIHFRPADGNASDFIGKYLEKEEANFEFGNFEEDQNDVNPTDFEVENWEFGNTQKVQDENYAVVDTEEVNYTEVQMEDCILKIEPEEPKVVEQNILIDTTFLTDTAVSRNCMNVDEKEAEKLKAVMEIDAEIMRRTKIAREKYDKFQCQKIPCKFCGKEVVRAQMMTHIATLHDQNQLLLICDACGKKFYLKETLEKHKKIHIWHGTINVRPDIKSKEYSDDQIMNESTCES